MKMFNELLSNTIKIMYECNQDYKMIFDIFLDIIKEKELICDKMNMEYFCIDIKYDNIQMGGFNKRINNYKNIDYKKKYLKYKTKYLELRKNL